MRSPPAKNRGRASPGETPRAWQRMLSGRRLDLLDPSPLDVEIEDIAHGLARVARWNGQTVGAHIFSVAQHSLLVEKVASALDPAIGRTERLYLLLHDAPEYVIGDMISPFKAVIGDAYKSVEDRILGAILLRFSLPPAPLAVAAAPVQRGRPSRRFFRGGAACGLYTARSRAHLRPPGDPAAALHGRTRRGSRRGDEGAFSRSVSGGRRKLKKNVGERHAEWALIRLFAD